MGSSSKSSRAILLQVGSVGGLSELGAGKTVVLSDLLKSAFDRTFALFALIFFLPFFVLVAAAVAWRDGFPIFFAQSRVGKDGKRFKCYKFRTMVRDADIQLQRLLERDPAARAEWEATQKLTNDPRIHCMGRFLRKTSLDELPQFWNVLKGDMSVVGPRPIVPEEAHHYGGRYSDYLSVRPGITGLWQVSGRSATTYERRVALDSIYVRSRSMSMDLGIILRTLKVVLQRDGAC